MSRPWTRLVPPPAALLLAAVIVVACGGGGGTATGGTPGATAAAARSTTAGETAAADRGSPGPGAEGTAAPGPTAVDVCGLLPDAVITSITGAAVQDRDAFGGDESGLPACRIRLVTPPGNDEIVMSVQAGGGRVAYDRFYAPNAEEQDATPLDGLGDAALLQPQGSVVFVAGDTLYLFQYVTYPTPPDETVIALATAVLDAARE